MRLFQKHEIYIVITKAVYIKCMTQLHYRKSIPATRLLSKLGEKVDTAKYRLYWDDAGFLPLIASYPRYLIQ